MMLAAATRAKPNWPSWRRVERGACVIKNSFIKKLDFIFKYLACRFVNHCERPGMAASNAWV